jgi:DNA-binding PadR family transcriptional regulator
MTDQHEQQQIPSRRGKASAAQTRAAEHTLLGLLAMPDVSASGVHGYDLSRQFSHGVLAEIIRLEPGMLYHYLKSLAKRDLIVTTIERQTSRPDRQMHAITGAGREALIRWLESPVQATRELRLEFLLKLYLTRRRSDDEARDLIDRQRAVIERLMESLQQQQANVPDDDADALFRRQILGLRITQNRAALDWLDTL